jgi:hypothetical protein
MSNVVVVTSPTLEGVMQAPGRPDEDPVPGSRRRHRRRRPVTTLRLLDTKPATTGVPVAIYQPIRTDGGHKHLGLN